MIKWFFNDRFHSVSHTFFKQMRLLDMKARKSRESREWVRKATAATVLSNNSFSSLCFSNNTSHFVHCSPSHYSTQASSSTDGGGLAFAIANESVIRTCYIDMCNTISHRTMPVCTQPGIKSDACCYSLASHTINGQIIHQLKSIKLY